MCGRRGLVRAHARRMVLRCLPESASPSCPHPADSARCAQRPTWRRRRRAITNGPTTTTSRFRAGLPRYRGRRDRGTTARAQPHRRPVHAGVDVRRAKYRLLDAAQLQQALPRRVLAQSRFPTLARAGAGIELWRVDDNERRPHSALAYEPPKSFGDKARRLRRGLPAGLPLERRATGAGAPVTVLIRPKPARM
jgi:hypothetical protein